MPWKITRKESEKFSLRHQNCKEKSCGIYFPPKALFHAFLPGSLTVETALALPVFLFAATMILFLFRIMQVQYIVGNSLDQAVAEISLMGRITEKQAENLVKASFYKQLLAQDCPVSEIEYGIAGFSWKGTSVDVDDIDTLVTYRIQFPLRFFGTKSVKLSDGCRMHRWRGDRNGSAGSESGEWVYITPTQSVYHLSRECTHLKLSITAVSVERAKESYNPCGRCVKRKKPGAIVYITNTGTSYHMKVDCSGLKRTVYMILKEKVGNKRPCSRCGGK